MDLCPTAVALPLMLRHGPIQIPPGPGRPLRWHDLAFHDPELYENLKKLMAAGLTLPWIVSRTLSLTQNCKMQI